MTESAMTLSAAGHPLPKRWLAVIATIWIGQAVSMITSYAAGYAVVWYITETTGSALMLSAAAICAYLPQGLLSPFGGVIADKHNRKTVMIVADLGVGLVSLGLGVAILLGQVSFALLMILVVVRSIGQAFHGPAMMAAMPLLVPEKHLLRINTLDQLLMSVASIGAPAFGIFLYTTLGFHTVMFLDFFGALAAVAGLTVGMVAFAPLGAIFPLMTFDHFGGDGYAASLVEAAFGIGMVCGSIVLMAWGGGKRLALLIGVAALIVGATTMACGFLAPSMFWAFVALCAVMAIACAWFNGPLITLIQRNVAEEKTGRALGLSMAAMGLASPIGIALGGMLAESIGVAPFFVVDGAICLVLGLVVYLPKSVRALDHAPAVQPETAGGQTAEAEA